MFGQVFRFIHLCSQYRQTLFYHLSELSNILDLMSEMLFDKFLNLVNQIANLLFDRFLLHLKRWSLTRLACLRKLDRCLWIQVIHVLSWWALLLSLLLDHVLCDKDLLKESSRYHFLQLLRSIERLQAIYTNEHAVKINHAWNDELVDYESSLTWDELLPHVAKQHYSCLEDQFVLVVSLDLMLTITFRIS